MSLSRTTGAGAGVSARIRRNPHSLPAYSFVVSLAIVLVTVIAPDYSASADAGIPGDAPSPASTQLFSHEGDYSALLARDGYSVTMRPTAPAVGKPDPGTAQAIAYDLVLARGWDESQYSCLVALWNRESHWNVLRAQPLERGVRHPAGPPGEQDGNRGSRLGDEPQDPDHLGTRIHRGQVRDSCGAWEHSEQHHWY